MEKSNGMKTSLLFAVLIILSFSVRAQDDQKQKTMEIYGFIMMDAGYDANQINPDWYDVVRPTQLPAYKNEYGTNGNAYFSVRQTRLGFKNYFQTPLGELKTQFEFEMFGTGVDAGQTTIRLRHAYAELGKFGVGQYWSPFMDIDVFPNTVEYWGPSGMAFFRNIQIRYMPIQGASRLTFALERPGASADGGVYTGRVELQNVKPQFPVPDFSAEYRQAAKWGYVELGAIVRYMKWQDLDTITTGPDLSGNAVGWGLNLSTNINLCKNVIFRGSVLYGQGVENYMNDAPEDVALKKLNPADPVHPVKGVALPVTGVVAFFDINWNTKFSSSVGYSLIDIKNSDGQTGEDFRQGNYAIANLMWYPVKNAMMGAEFQWGNRLNYTDGWSTSISKIQFSFKYNFSQSFYKAKE
jgi:DcaP outer membrane protein